MPGVVLDAIGSTLAAGGLGHVPYVDFDNTGVSQVFAVTARVDTQGYYRPSPNNVTAYSSSVRLGLTEGDCRGATWGASLPVALDMTDQGFTFYMQFTRPMNGAEVDLPGCLGMLVDGIVARTLWGYGNAVSSGAGSVAQLLPVVGSGLGSSSGVGVVFAIQPVSGSGNAQSSGIGAISAVPSGAAGYGNGTSLGQGVVFGIQPVSGSGNATSSGSGAGSAYVITALPTSYGGTSSSGSGLLSLPSVAGAGGGLSSGQGAAYGAYTFQPSAGDGTVWATSVSFATARNAASGGGNYGTQTGSTAPGFGSEAGYYLYRAHLPFDTSALDDSKTVQAATLQITQYGPVGTTQAVIVQSREASTSALANSDWSLVGSSGIAGATELSDRKTISTAGTVTFTLNAAGLALINRTGFTRLAIVSIQDLTNSAPGTDQKVYMYFSEYATSSSRPLLTVTQ